MAKKSKRTNKRKVSKRHYRKKNKKTRKIYKRKMMRGGSEESKDLIRQFIEFTGLDEKQAGIKLAEAGGRFDLAIENFFSEKEQPAEGVQPETGSGVVDPIDKLMKMFPGMSPGQAKFLLEEGGDIYNAILLYIEEPAMGTGAAAPVAPAAPAEPVAPVAPAAVAAPINVGYDFDGVLHISISKYENKGKKQCIDGIVRDLYQGHPTSSKGKFTPNQELIDNLKANILQGNKVFIISRNPSPGKKAFLEENLTSAEFSQITITDTPKPGESKGKLLRKYGIDKFYEDSTSEIYKLAGEECNFTNPLEIYFVKTYEGNFNLPNEPYWVVKRKNKFSALSYNVCTGCINGGTGKNKSSTPKYDDKCKKMKAINSLFENKCEENIINIILGKKYPFTFVGIQEAGRTFGNKVLEYGKTKKLRKNLKFIRPNGKGLLIYNNDTVDLILELGGDIKSGRPWVCGLFENKSDGNLILVISLHGPHGGWNVDTIIKTIFRNKNLQGVVNKIPVLLMGDFNQEQSDFKIDNSHIFFNSHRGKEIKTGCNDSGFHPQSSSQWDRTYNWRPDNIFYGNPIGGSGNFIVPVVHEVPHFVPPPKTNYSLFNNTATFHEDISSNTSDHLPVGLTFYF